MNKKTRFATEREWLHKELLSRHVLSIDGNGVASIADKGSRLSVAVAAGIVGLLPGTPTPIDKSAGQTAGSRFEEICRDFLRKTFLRLEHLRPGEWQIEAGTSGIANFEQYKHLLALDEAAKTNPVLAAALGTDYLIKPDVVISRAPEPDKVINRHELLVNDSVSQRASLRVSPESTPLLHASISTKWTLRSDRAQNARTEALNLIRNRKGRVPHVVVVTAEPMPSRIASLALGTGDIDCVYHVFLDEVVKVVRAMAKNGNAEESSELLNTMIDGHRLRDISDLPLDLAV